jgi:hypothetical protein
MGSRSKTQMTAAKRMREQAVKERRALKLEKKQAARAAKAAAAAGTPPASDAEQDELTE